MAIYMFFCFLMSCLLLLSLRKSFSHGLTPINTERREEILARHEEHEEEKRRRRFSHKKAQKTQKTSITVADLSSVTKI